MKGFPKKLVLALSVLALMAVNIMAQSPKTTITRTIKIYDPQFVFGDDLSGLAVQYINQLSITSASADAEGWWTLTLTEDCDQYSCQFPTQNFSLQPLRGGTQVEECYTDNTGWNRTSSNCTAKFPFIGRWPGSGSFSTNNGNDVIATDATIWILPDRSDPDFKPLISYSKPRIQEFTFYFLPPGGDDLWILGTPYLEVGGKATAMQGDPSRCGWYKSYWFGEEPPTSALVQLGPGSTSEQMGEFGVEESAPTRFNLIDKFGSLVGKDENGLIKKGTIYFVSEDGSLGWLKDDPMIDESHRCSYNFAAIIYDTDSEAAGMQGVFHIGGPGSVASGISKGIAKPELEKDSESGRMKMTWAGKTTNLDGWTADAFRNAFKPTTGTNVVRCYDMPFRRNKDALWEFNSNKLCADGSMDLDGICGVKSLREPTGNPGFMWGYFPPELKTRDTADYSACQTCDTKQDAAAWVPLKISGTDYVSQYCYDRGRKGTGSTLAACGAEFAESDFRDGDNPAVWDWGSNVFTRPGDNTIEKKNAFFCFESAPAKFKYDPGQEFFFSGDDDIWVFINNQLVIDLGGTHLAAPGYVNLKESAGKLGLEEGKEYDINIFFCDRRLTMSNVRIATHMYFSQNTGLFVNGNVETADAPICLNKSGGGNCGVAMGDDDGEAKQLCGPEIAGNLHYFMQRRNGDRTGLDLDKSNGHCTESGDVLTCYGGITINTANGTVKVDKAAIARYGGSLAGTYFIYVETKNIDPKPPARQITRFSMGSSIFAIWGDIQDEAGGAVPGLPLQLKSVTNGNQSTLAGKRVPIAFADGAWIGDNAFAVSDAVGLSISISRSGLTNEDSTAELKIYKDEAGTIPVSLNESIPIPNDTKVLVLWVTGSYEASEEFTYQVNVQGSNQSPHKITVRLPKLEFVECGTTNKKSDAWGSDPDADPNTTRMDRAVYIGVGLDRCVAAFDTAKNDSLCTTCNFKITVNAWLTDKDDIRITGAGEKTDNSVLRPDPAEIVNGVGKFSFRGVAEVKGPDFTPAYAALSVRGPSTKEDTKAYWNGMVFTKPPVPIPKLVEIFDKDGDGKGDSLRIAYDRKFRKASQDSLPPNKIEVLWDLSMKEPLKFGLGELRNGKYELDNDRRDANWDFWTSNSEGNFNIKMESDSIITISGKVVGEDELGRGINASFSDGIKTSKGAGNVVVKNWATYKNQKSDELTTSDFDWEISDRIPAIVVSAIFNPGSCDRDVGPCNDQVIITLSEPVQKADGATDDRSGNLPTLAAPFQYRLVHDVSKDSWNTYAQSFDLPATRNSRSNIIWRPSTGQVEPEGQRDSIVAITYTYYPSVNTPLRGDSVKFAYPEYSLVDLAPAYTVDGVEVFAGGNRPNPNERGRRFVGEISITTGKVPIGEVNPEKTLEDVIEEIKKRNPNLKDVPLFKDGVTDYLPVPEGWTAKQVQEQYPGTVGIIIKPDVASKGVSPENISFHASAFYHTNLGNYVVETTPLRELKCNDAIFNGNCASGNGMGVYLAWNMRDAKNRWAGAGAYVEVYDFYWEIKNSGEQNGSFDKMSKKIEMLGVKRTKKKN